MSIAVQENEIPVVDIENLGFLKGLSTPIWIFDFDTFLIRWANRNALSFWAAESVEALGIRSLKPDTEGVRSRLANLRIDMEKGGQVTEQWTLFPAGHPTSIMCTCTGIRLVDGHVAMIIEAESIGQETLLTSEMRMVEAVRHTPLMIWMFTPEGRVLMRNPAAVELVNQIGLLDDDASDSYLDLFVDADRAADVRRMAMARGEATALLTLAGSPSRIHDVKLRRVIDPLSGGIALLAAQQDVTQAHRLERQLQSALRREQDASEAQRHFLSIASHEFKSPLSVIDGAAQRILRSESNPDAFLVDRIGSIRTSVQRLVDAVDNMLAMIRIDERKVGCELQPADLVTIVERVCTTLQAIARDREIDLDLAEMPPLMIDPALTAQIFENIISNAVKYSSSDSPIKISGRLSARFVIVSVTDSGIGIPAKDMVRLFGRFFRASNVGVIHGTGLGLSTVRYFMRLQKGQVRIRSREGIGTSVELRFRR